MLILGSKMPQLPHLGPNKNFPQQIGSITLMRLLKPKFKQKIR